MRSLQPLPQALLTAAKLREEARRLNLLAAELEGAYQHEVPPIDTDVSFRFGEVKQRQPRRNAK